MDASISDSRKKRILELDDADFLSFLFSERDRENSLSQFHGWNNWALIGAFVTVLCAGYALLRENRQIDWHDVFYYSGCLLAYFLIYHSWSRAFKRQRGIDFSKVRMMKEVVPYVQIVYVFICAVASAVLIPILDGFNHVFWWWIVIVVVFIILSAIIVVLKNKLVPVFFEELYLPWIWWNTLFACVFGFVFAHIANMSFEMTAGDVLSSEFAVAACVAGCLILSFVFITINTGNKSVRRFDAIIDAYLYMGASKEKTLSEISKNRMGYGVMDSCEKELQLIEKKKAVCDKEELELQEIKRIVQAGQYDLDQVIVFQKRTKEILNSEQEALNLTKKLSARLKEMISVASFIEDNTEFNAIMEKNFLIDKQVYEMTTSVLDIVKLIEERKRVVDTERIHV